MAVALLALAPAASGCDVCGCSIGGNYFGILPQFNRHFVGLRWSEQHFRSAHTRGALLAGHDVNDEHFRTVDLLGRFYPFHRVQMLVLAPYHDFSRQEHGALLRAKGLGDASVLASYVLFNTGDSLRRRWQHTFTLGGGVKLPTGRHRLTDAEGEPLHANLQPGSGSTDALLTAAYTLRRGAWGLSADGTARWNTANRNHYRFGHRVSGGAKLFYWKNLGRFTLLPNAGVFSDAALPDREAGETVEGTGGYAMLATLGLDVYAGRISAGFTAQLPVHQQLSEGAVRAGNRWMATVNYIF